MRNNSQSLRLFLRSAARMWPFFLSLPIAAMVMAILALWPPWVMQLLVDDVLPSGNVRRLLWLSGSIFAATLVMFLVDIARNLLIQYSYQRVLNRVRTEVIDVAISLPVGVSSRLGAGELASRIAGDIAGLGGLLLSILQGVTGAAATLIASLMLLWHLEGSLLLVCALVIPLDIGLLVVMRNRMLGTQREARRSGSSVAAFVQEILLGVATIRTLYMRQPVLSQLNHYQHIQLWAQMRMQAVSAIMGLSRGTIKQLPSLIALGYGGTLVVRGDLTVGQLLTFYAIIDRVLGPVESLVDLCIAAVGVRVHTERLDEILAAPRSPQASPGRSPAGTAALAPAGLILLRDVSVDYGNGDVLKDVNVDIQPGQLTVILGKSGSGKSTLAALLARAIVPSKGQVLVRDVDLHALPEETLGHEVCVVRQEPFFFSCSIEENLRFARADASDDALMEALRLADLDDAVLALPGGLNAKMHDRGTTFSGGELRRLALARALLLSPRWLVLDETLSSVDACTEARIVHKIRAARPNMGIIIITHRLSAVSLSDEVIILSDGRIEAAGPHRELLARCEMYRYWYAQSDASNDQPVPVPP